MSELNVPLKTRVLQLQLTLERYRWIPPDFPEPPIIVNIPEFQLRTMRRQPASYLTMRVVVGKAMRTQTPVFAQNMKYLIFRPYWLVPTSILRNETIPKTRRNPDYLAANGFEVVDGNGNIVPSSPASDDVHRWTSFRFTTGAAEAGTEECARFGEVHIPQSVQRLSA